MTAHDFVRDYSPLTKVAETLSDSYETVRRQATDGDLPAKRDGNGRIYVDREFALRLSEERPKFRSLSHAISYINHE